MQLHDNCDNLSYNVTITATDGENTNATQLMVIVEDVNDNSPIFSDGSCQLPVTVPEVNILVYCDISGDIVLLLTVAC